jgi:hypothetical protein
MTVITSTKISNLNSVTSINGSDLLLIIGGGVSSNTTCSIFSEYTRAYIMGCNNTFSNRIVASSGIQFPDGSIMTTAAAAATGMASTTDLSFAADTDANGSGIISFSVGGVVQGEFDTDGFYIGSSGSDGSWRICKEDDNLVFQQRESSVWVTKGSILGYTE